TTKNEVTIGVKLLAGVPLNRTRRPRSIARSPSIANPKPRSSRPKSTQTLDRSRRINFQSGLTSAATMKGRGTRVRIKGAADLQWFETLSDYPLGPARWRRHRAGPTIWVQTHFWSC